MHTLYCNVVSGLNQAAEEIEIAENGRILSEILGENIPQPSTRVDLITDAARGIAHKKYSADEHPEDDELRQNPEKLEQLAEKRESHWTEYKEAHAERYYDGVVLLLLQQNTK